MTTMRRILCRLRNEISAIFGGGHALPFPIRHFGGRVPLSPAGFTPLRQQGESKTKIKLQKQQIGNPGRYDVHVRPPKSRASHSSALAL